MSFGFICASFSYIVNYATERARERCTDKDKKTVKSVLEKGKKK